MIDHSQVYRIGQLTKPHGVRGEVAFLFTDDVFDRVECDYLVLELDGILVPFYLEENRFKSDSVALVKFQDYDTAEQARRFTNVSVFFPVALAAQRQAQELSWDFFVGFTVADCTAGNLGVVAAVDNSTINTLFVIHHHGTELLVPAQEAFIRQLDTEARHILLQLPAGLLDLNQAEEV